MSDSDTATGEGMPEPRGPKAPSEPVEAPSSDTTTVRVESPFWCTEFRLPKEDGDTLVIDRSGVEVANSDLEALLDAATKSGVSLSTEVSA
jgi:hypothetical protein